MGSLREITENLSVFDYARFFFKSQTLVVYSVSAHDYVRLPKIALISAIRYYLLQLHMLGHDKDTKRGFVLYKFKYYELSVYLHGLMQFYCSLKGFPPVGNLFIKQFSHLPHDVVKTEKEVVTVDCSLLRDACSSSNVYVAIYNEVVYTGSSFESLKSLLSMDFPNKNLVFTLK